MQAQFVIHYKKNGGDRIAAALSAGYSPNNVDQLASKLLKHPLIKKALKVNIKARELSLNGGRVASKEEVLIYWSAVMLEPDSVFGDDDKKLSVRDREMLRMKASEYLAKHLGLFETTININNNTPPEDLQKKLDENIEKFYAAVGKGNNVIDTVATPISKRKKKEIEDKREDWLKNLGWAGHNPEVSQNEEEKIEILP